VRVVFFGSPAFAVPSLQALAEDATFEVALVVTQGANEQSPVELAAYALDLPVYKPHTLRDAASRQPLLAAEADLFVVAAFGLIFRQGTLDIPRLGAVNVHPSLLPKYRGASPIAAAVAAGDDVSGVSIMVMDSGIDTGAVISVERVVVANDDTTESLGERLAGVGASLLTRDVPLWAAGRLEATPQAIAGASLTRTLTKADGWIDWTASTRDIERHVRAMWPWPRAWTTIDGVPMQIHRAGIAADAVADLKPGTVAISRRRIVVACGDGGLELFVVEPSGRRAMTVAECLNGRRAPLVVFGDQGAPPAQPPFILPIASAVAG
jgi:methionyl-tRNA formyltransferase